MITESILQAALPDTKKEALLAFKNKGISFIKLENNPKKYVLELSVSQLSYLVRVLKHMYYNEIPLVSDAIYDTIEEQLLVLKPEAVGVGSPVTDGKKVNLPHYMGSLDKIKSEKDIASWTKTHKGPYVISDKLDGISLLLVSDGKKWKIYTRGKGDVGKDVSFLSKFMTLPEPTTKIAVRCEAIVSVSRFKKYFAENQANPRNTASGIFNKTKDISGAAKALKHVTIIAYEMIEPIMKPSQQMTKLKELDFKVVPHTIFYSLSEAELTTRLAERKSKSIFEIDGLVITQDIKYTRSTSGNPDYSIAFKSDIEGDIVLAVVEKVEWQISRYNSLKPVVIVKEFKGKLT